MIMTTREENLKKIQERFEMMTDEQLEQVAGGTVGGLFQFRTPAGTFIKYRLLSVKQATNESQIFSEQKF